MDQLETPVGEVVINGMVMSVEPRQIRDERTILSIAVTDFTDSIIVKMFIKNEQLEDIYSFVKKGNFLKIKGIAAMDKFDQEITISNVSGIRKGTDNRSVRTDLALNKRVELHCHTKMSDMDGVSYASDIINQAIKWGHKAVAITDHGVVQAFTEAYHTMQKLWGKYEAKGEKLDFKVIYGVEAYLVDDTKKIVTNPKGQDFAGDFVVFDLETTGFSALVDKVIEIGAVKIRNGEIVDRFSTFVNPKVPISFRIENLTGISDQMVMGSKTIEEILPEFLEFCEGCVMVAHNAEFDMSFIINNAERQGLEFSPSYIDTVLLSQFLIPALHNYKLDTLTKHLNVVLDNHHRAVDDAEATAHIFLKLIKMLADRDIFTLDKLNEEGALDEESIKKLHQYHCIILAANEMGRINLYRLVSASHMKYFNRFPKIPKSLVNQYREGLIIGSACEAGELFRAMVNGRSDAEIARIVSFYDYLEIQPIGNNAFLIRNENFPDVQTDEDLIKINLKVAELAKKLNKMLIATCDVHFLNAKDSIYRAILMKGKGFEDAEKQPPLYLRTTDEMLKEFSYLGEELAYEAVVTNPRKIADMVEVFKPIPDELYSPMIPGADQEIHDMSYAKARELYGENLPKVVQDRLELELNSIIGHGFAVLYLIAHKLVKKSLDDGYLVGSRGSVGSSFVATMTNITEVNPLPPHWRCPHCRHSEFIEDGTYGCGFDMPDKDCPHCGTKMIKDGHDIPFAVFMGFDGDKVPDIDLNFSGDYQPVAHKYTEELFGKDNVFRAGTIATVADKTAYGYVKKFFDEKGIKKRDAYINSLVNGCTGVKRTTGQHPGGIMVIPRNMDVHHFTPIQRPADDTTTNTITTHFDYHSISSRLVKLDILGHDDPTVIKMLENITHRDPRTIPFDDPATMSIFSSTEALGVTPEELGATSGTFGIPEFRTPFTRQMLDDTKPKKFSDLVRISGFSHGTNVWLENAQDLITSGTCTVSDAISCRDDIMMHLIHSGIDPLFSFKTMEKVRKGKGLSEDDIKVMKDGGIPQWYIDSCLKIKYLFPRAHATAYVMMAYRIAFCKVHYPLAFYAAYFSIRAAEFDADIISKGKLAVRDKLDEIIELEKQKKLSVKDKGFQVVLELAWEMYLRGFSVEKVDLYKSNADKFILHEKSLLPPFTALTGISTMAANNIVQARLEGEFTSIDDLKKRASLSTPIVERLREHGCLDGLQESDQISLFS